MVTGGSVLASGAQPPASVTDLIWSKRLVMERHIDRRTDRVNYGGSTLPKNPSNPSEP